MKTMLKTRVRILIMPILLLLVFAAAGVAEADDYSGTRITLELSSAITSTPGSALGIQGETSLADMIPPTFTKKGYKLGKFTPEGTHTAVAEADGTLIADVPGYTDADGKWIYQATDNLTLIGTVNPITYSVKFDANVPRNASTKCSRSMADEMFTYNNAKLLEQNQYILPGYEFVCWTTKPDGTGYKFDDKTSINTSNQDNLAPDQDGDTVTLYAKWKPKPYNITLRGTINTGAISNSYSYILQAVFDQPVKLITIDELKSLQSPDIPWILPDNCSLHGWHWDEQSGVFYADGAPVVNLCTVESSGDITGWKLDAELISGTKIVITTTENNRRFSLPWSSGVSNPGFHLSSGGATYDLQTTEYPAGTYTAMLNGFDEGNYQLSMDCGSYVIPQGKQTIEYDGKSSVSVILDYYTVSMEKDDHISGAWVRKSGDDTYPTELKHVPGGATIEVGATAENGYHFDGYSVTGIPPEGFSSLDPDAASQSDLTVRGEVHFKAYADANSYKVHFDKNGGSDIEGEMPDQDMVCGQPQDLFPNKFRRASATFKGWNTQKNGSGTAYEDGQSVQNLTTENNGVVTLYAQWDVENSANQQDPNTVLLAKMKAKGKRSMTISWNKVNGADGYDIFFARCNGKNMTAADNVKTVKAGQKLKWTKKKGLKKKTPYKAYVKAYTMKNGKKTYIKTSPLMHAYTSGATKNYSNAKALTVNKAEVTLKTGSTFNVKAKVTKVKKHKKLMRDKHVSKLRYLSSNEKVATVSEAGTITAKAKGTCSVYVYTHNGISKKIKVTVE